MKATLLYIYALLAALTLGACSDNYLDTESNDAEKRLILSKTSYIAMAVNGLSKMMSTQYLSSQGMNGEGAINTYPIRQLSWKRFPKMRPYRMGTDDQPRLR